MGLPHPTAGTHVRGLCAGNARGEVRGRPVPIQAQPEAEGAQARLAQEEDRRVQEDQVGRVHVGHAWQSRSMCPL
eukprot:4828520-Pyramimonas_sp.AAC.1